MDDELSLATAAVQAHEQLHRHIKTKHRQQPCPTCMYTIIIVKAYCLGPVLMAWGMYLAVKSHTNHDLELPPYNEGGYTFFRKL